ncbi:MAG: ADP-glyceromanno-heptose 6-epimerase [bacterium]|nr:ADP-glyceromanno-heptose 6-epimerase [bacterium]
MFIVTGGAGFIGSAFVRKLNDEGISDIIIVDSLGSDQKWQNLNGKKFFDYIHKDKFLNLIENDALSLPIKGIIHLGACSTTTETDGEYMMSNNYRYTKILAEWALERKVRFIYASSAATYGDGKSGYSDSEENLEKFKPLNLYGFSKHAFDMCAFETGACQKIAGLKFFNVYGPNEYHKGDQASVAFKGFNSIKSSGKIKLFKSHHQLYKDGEFYRDFIYVKDCLDVLWWLLNKPKVNGIFNLGTGKASSWNDLALALFKALNLEPNIEYIEMPENIRNQYQYLTQASMEKLKKAGCPVSFRTIEDGVKDYVENYLEKEDRYY